MFEYETKDGQMAIALCNVSYVSKSTDKNSFVVGFTGGNCDFLYVPLEQYTKFMDMLKAWAMKH
ncbi:hypothetical protein EFM54_11905 [Lentilactobacillus buchneri]|uniref:hypothetical protein n=1 Tax=Lentilactobacillus buchneri TaxID=1581 RepID=UPI0021A56C82|nr:hypothetical protein [Lentilactobacillus buchneri]MCT2899668.1 hypothetical protein [Lentilactobacillus buchneri]